METVFYQTISVQKILVYTSFRSLSISISKIIDDFFLTLKYFTWQILQYFRITETHSTDNFQDVAETSFIACMFCRTMLVLLDFRCICLQKRLVQSSLRRIVEMLYSRVIK